jgi:hypothetical protein
VFSHVVMNQVDDLEGTYAHCGRWLRPGGWMSHQIDFGSLGTADEWNGHLEFGERTWKVMAGKRPYYVNRERLGGHLERMRRNGFAVKTVLRRTEPGGLTRARLAPRWRHMSEEDFATRTAFVVAQRLPAMH